MIDLRANELRFIKHCMAYGRASVGRAYRALPAIQRAVAQLRHQIDKGRNFLSVQCEHNNPFVQLHAAAYLLPFDEHAARMHLNSLHGKYDVDRNIHLRTVSLQAEALLDQWDAGNVRKYLFAVQPERTEQPVHPERLR